ncbi:GlsB/YeaQ/YmgE family stress response membrane protein [Paraburkholderia sp. C35]|uniref:GlsB/YeaQ/YmgE family stress response membrane protein n=1 Tax=Paraburkholderia sp. C35 TaxID=2126993 RepID=UPI000D69D047|nr:GlsB/YeaQ/YmgE family stress response membrane protein [Paraburkholderia sp. C35]
MEHGFIAWLIIGCIAGWLASVVVSGSGFGVILDIVVGGVGAFIGGWLSGVLHISFGNGWIGSTITAFIGAVILLFVIRLFRRR